MVASRKAFICGNCDKVHINRRQADECCEEGIVLLIDTIPKQLVMRSDFRYSIIVTFELHVAGQRFMMDSDLYEEEWDDEVESAMHDLVISEGLDIDLFTRQLNDAVESIDDSHNEEIIGALIQKGAFTYEMDD